jgi:hypothetical protein
LVLQEDVDDGDNAGSQVEDLRNHAAEQNAMRTQHTSAASILPSGKQPGGARAHHIAAKKTGNEQRSSRFGGPANALLRCDRASFTRVLGTSY